MRVINVSLNELETKLLMIGFQGENQITQVRIDAAEILTDHPNATPTLIAKPLFGFAYPVIVTKEGTDIVWEIDNSVLSFHGDGEIQLTFTEGTVIAKSYVGRIRIKRSLAVNGEKPDPIETWEQAATAKLAEVDAQISELEGMVDAAEAAKDEAQDIVDDAAADIQAAGQTQIAAVEAKGEEVKESIPADYSTLSGDVSGLKSAFNDLQERLEIAISHVDNAVNSFGMSSNAKQALLEALQHIAWIDNAGETYYDAVYDGFYNDTWPITQNLTNCVSTNALTEILNNAEYYAIVVPTLGYTLDGATISISMNGVDITRAVYDNGTIHIQAVTGELEININANNLAVESLTALFDQGGDTIYTSDTLNSLKPYLTVTAEYVNGASKILDDSEYTISGTIAVGQSTLTVSYGGKTANFTVTAVQGLPQGYTSIKWIETNGGSYTQTSALSGPGLSAKYKVRITGERADGRNGHIFTGGSCVFPFFRSTTNTSNHNLMVMNHNGHNNSGVTYNWQLDTDYEVSAYIQGDSISVNGTNVTSWTEGESTNVGNMYLFCAGSTTDIAFRFIGRFYYLELYDSGTLVHKYMPCINSSDIVGVYDTITNEFFSSNTSTPFVAGGVY